MTDNIESLILDLLEWINREQRTYRQTMDAWRTSCPRLPVWEEANRQKLVERISSPGRSIVRITPAGTELLNKKRTHGNAQEKTRK
jgi:D-3-phosphoglycerate dehydrogenase